MQVWLIQMLCLKLCLPFKPASSLACLDARYILELYMCIYYSTSDLHNHSIPTMHELTQQCCFSLASSLSFSLIRLQIQLYDLVSVLLVLLTTIFG